MITTWAEVYNFIILGGLGGFCYCLIQKLGWSDKFEWARRVILGSVAGYLTYIAGLPNHLTSFGLGYFAIDAIEAIENKVKVIVNGNKNGD